MGLVDPPTFTPAPAPSDTPKLLLRRALLLVAAAAAAIAVVAGLARLGIAIGVGGGHLADHGPIFVLGVFGTLIALERAVAVGRRWSLVAPGLSAVGVVAMLTGLSWAPWIAVASGVALVVVNAAIVHRQAAAFTWLMLTGSVLLVAGETAWALGRAVYEVVPTWLAFFVLTIVAERLELSRLAPTPRWASRPLIALAAILALASFGSLLRTGILVAGFGVSMVGIGAWQLRFDLARRLLRRPGLPRFTAVSVLLGTCWLVPAGALFGRGEILAAGPIYDAALHAVLVGYVLSMVFAHAPIILPAVARLRFPFSPVLYLPLVVLHSSLVARIVGDLVPNAPIRRLGAIGNTLALVMFVLAVAFARIRGLRPRSADHEVSNA